MAEAKSGSIITACFRWIMIQFIDNTFNRRVGLFFLIQGVVTTRSAVLIFLKGINSVPHLHIQRLRSSTSRRQGFLWTPESAYRSSYPALPNQKLATTKNFVQLRHKRHHPLYENILNSMFFWHISLHCGDQLGLWIFIFVVSVKEPTIRCA